MFLMSRRQKERKYPAYALTNCKEARKAVILWQKKESLKASLDVIPKTAFFF